MIARYFYCLVCGHKHPVRPTDRHCEKCGRKG